MSGGPGFVHGIPVGESMPLPHLAPARGAVEREAARVALLFRLELARSLRAAGRLR